MRVKVYTQRGLATLAFALGVLLPSAAGVLADDTDLFTSVVAPNVVFSFDTSGSMNNVVWHKAYRPDVVYDPITCPYVADPEDPAYDPKCLQFPLCNIAMGDAGFTPGWDDYWNDSDKTLRIENEVSAVTRCSETRDVFVDPEVRADNNLTRWQLKYLNWYFSDNVNVDHDGDGHTILWEILNETEDRSQCVLDADPTKAATYTKYFERSRVSAAKEVLREVICQTSQIADIRYGLARFYGGGDPDGGYVSVPVADYSDAHANDLEDKITGIEAGGWTPLSETLYNVYRYFMSRVGTETALGANSTRFPVYAEPVSSDFGAPVPGFPVTDVCQKHFVILITDGEPLKDDFDDMNLAQFQGLIGDYNVPGDEDELPPNTFFAPDISAGSCNGNEWDPNSRSCEISLYLDDIAKFMATNDFLPDAAYPGTQVIETYTVGFTTTAATNDLLSRAAAAGNGEFFFSYNAEELAEGLTKAIMDIVAKAKAFTAATVPASRATDGNNFFTSYFMPSAQGPFWQGHLKLFEFNARGEIRDEPVAAGVEGECALDDPAAPASCREGELKLTLEGYWDAANEIPAPASRNLYVSKYQGAPPGAIPATPEAFTEGNISASDLGVAGATAADISAYDLSLDEFDTTGIATDEDLADAIVRYIRGCEFRSGACVDRGDGNKLWDIFHSNPVVVGPPNAALREGTYREFVRRYKHRKRVIYAGSNGGFVHGFNTGEYDTAAMPGTYDRGTGAEEFGFMAYPARQNIAELPKDTPPREFYYMDGSPSAADVWLPTAATSQPADGTWNDWRTVLVGGMRQGGRAVWALDVTNPPDHNSPNGEQATGPDYPSYLWEFPCEAGSCDAWRPYMGETWSQPVITRVKATVDCNEADWANCAMYDRWVAIFGGGYDSSGDPNMPHDADGTVAASEYDPSADADTLLAGRALFMVDVATGELLAAKRFQHDGTAGDPADGEPGMQYAIASEPAVFDLDFDGYADVVYVGDLGGNVWKWVIYPPAEDHIRGTSGDDHQERWKFLKILEAENCTSCAPKHYKSFFYPPTGAVVGQYLWLALGSGERNDLDFGRDGGLSDAEKNRYYVFKDSDPFELERNPATLPYTDVAPSTDFIEGTTIADFNPNTCLAAGNVGFYFEGEDGEKFITDSVIFFGVVLTGSYVPAPSTADACTATGRAYLYGFNLLCGEGVFPPQNAGDPNQRRIEIGAGSGGLPNAPRVSVGPVDDDDDGDDCTDMVVVITSEGSGFEDCLTERPDSGLRVKSWRDL